MVRTRSSVRAARGEKRDLADGNADGKQNDSVLVSLSPTGRDPGLESRKIPRRPRKPCPSLDSLNDDVFSFIFTLFDHPRDVYNLAHTSKRLLSLVTPEAVVRSAVFQGGRCKKAISAVMEDLRKRSIYHPSTHRLLRLVNGLRCERWERCWAFDLKEQQAARVMCPPRFGIFVCKKCVRGNTTKLPRWDQNVPGRRHFAIEQDRVAVARIDYVHRVLNDDYKERGTGDYCGPILCAVDIRQIESTFHERTSREEQLKYMLETFDEEESGEDEQEKTSALVKIFDTAVEQEKSFKTEKLRLQRAKEDERSQKKITMLQPKLAMLADMLDDAEPWKAIAMETEIRSTWHDRSYRWLIFSCTIVHSITFDLRCAPSNGTKMITNMATEIREKMSIIYSKNILDLSFIVPTDAHPMERALVSYCASQQWTPHDMLTRHQAGRDFVQLLSEDKQLDALFRLIGYDAWKHVFAIAVNARNANEESLARTIWRCHASATYLNGLSDLTMTYDSWRPRYDELRGKIQEYFEKPATVRFRDTVDGNENVDEIDDRKTRQEILDTIWRDTDSFNLLRASRFQEILRNHRIYYTHQDSIPAELFDAEE